MVSIDDLNDAYKRINPYIVKTPIHISEALNKKCDSNIFLKDETKQLTGSFKIRGALSALSKLKQNNINGVVAFSSGNHAQGVSKAAQIFDMEATIVMPEDAPKNKIEKTKKNGATIVFYKRHIESREEIATKLAKELNFPLVKPFDNEDIIAGQGSFGLEVAEFFLSSDIKLDILLSCTSGGGLVAGTGIAIKHFFPDALIYPVEPFNCNDTEISLKNKTRTRLKKRDNTICDALEVEIPGEITFPINKMNCKKGLSVTDTEVIVAMKFLYQDLGIIAEPSGCVSLAAVLSKKIDVSGKNTLITISGGNVDQSYFNKLISA